MHMNKLTTALIFTFLAFSNHVVAGNACLLEGRWKSNKEMTLASMNATGVVSEKQRALFHGDFFGELIIQSTCDSFTSYFDGTSDTSSYETLSQNGTTITIRYEDPTENSPVDTTLTIIDGCYSIPLKNLNFNEYFCRIE